MRLVLVHARFELIQLVRYPAFAIPMLAFPSLIMVMIGFSSGAPRQLLMVSFAGYAVLAVAFFQFGVVIAVERANPWSLFMRALPLDASTRICGRLVAALVVSGAAAGAVITVSLACGAAPLPPVEWLRLAVVLVGGSVPFALLGIGLGYTVSARAALPVANMLYMLMAYLGGLWGTQAATSHGILSFGRYLPTHAWAELLRSVPTGAPLPVWPCELLTIYAVAFGVFAVNAYDRAEAERYG